MNFEEDDSKIQLGHILIANAVLLKASGKQSKRMQQFQERMRQRERTPPANPAIKFNGKK